MVKVTAGRIVIALYNLALALVGILVIVTLVDTIRNNMARPVLSTSLGVSTQWAALILIFAGMLTA